MKRMIYTAALALCLVVAGTYVAHAQNTYKNHTLGYTITMPQGWGITVDTPNMRYHNAEAKAKGDISQADILETITFKGDSTNAMILNMQFIPPHFKGSADSFFAVFVNDTKKKLTDNGIEVDMVEGVVYINDKKIHRGNIRLVLNNRLMEESDVYYWSDGKDVLFTFIRYTNDNRRKIMTKAFLDAINTMQ